MLNSVEVVLFGESGSLFDFDVLPSMSSVSSSLICHLAFRPTE
jgi:hypothetical protein